MHSLRKSKKVLLHVASLYRAKKKRLSAASRQEVETLITDLSTAILEKNREKAQLLSVQAKTLAQGMLRKSFGRKSCDLLFALTIALAAATLIRQVWFELYEIPSGSMRPTLKEQDLLIVSKTNFGINMPLMPRQIYFDPDLCQRGGIVVFTGEGMQLRDADTVYFYLFPGKKQYVKRLIGKPGDTLYFYGGNIYGVDGTGRDISAELQAAQLQGIEHIPFIRFEGDVSSVHSVPVQGIYTPIILRQMGESLAKLYLGARLVPSGELLPPFNELGVDYGDLLGMNNFATARLLIDKETAYLELRHHPSLEHLSVGVDSLGRMRPMLALSTSTLPLEQKHLRTLFSHLYTARFIVKDGLVMRYGAGGGAHSHFLPRITGVPDGCYEFYDGKAYAVQWKGITEELTPDHPLYLLTPERMQFWFNLGIEFDTRFAPELSENALPPHRYAYFRNQELYLMGAPLLSLQDGALKSFVEREKSKEAAQPTYRAFIDRGPPLLTDGALDVEFIRRLGVVVPPKSYLVLGDNHAMSGDSREFGFVPESNLRGAPDWIFWPPGKRWGEPNQHPYPWINGPRSIIWAIAAIGFGLWWAIHRRRTRLPLSL